MIIERIMNIRDMGKSIFFDTQSEKQYYINNKFKDFELAKTLNRGDLINVITKEFFITKTMLLFRNFTIRKRLFLCLI